MSNSTSPYSNMMNQLVRPTQSPQGINTQPSSTPEIPALIDDPLTKVREARNPLLEAARPLLRALAELAEITDVQQMEPLRQTLIRDVQHFQSLCDRAHLRREHVVTVRYCLCTALDESINKLPWARDGAWADHSLLLLFHNETSGGEKFFLLLGRMAQSSAEHLPALEVLYRILSLGFEGRYALSSDGLRQLETIHRRLLSILAGHTPAPQAQLSPHWQGVGKGRLPFMRTLPVWITASVLALVLTGVYLTLSTKLETPSLALEQHLQRLINMTIAPEIHLTPLPRWFTEEQKKRYSIEVDEARSTIRFSGSSAFTGGDILPAMYPALEILAQRLKETKGRIAVVGHTDDTPLRTGSRFTSNQHLSEERARSVTRHLIERGVHTSRFITEGKGASQPLSAGSTAQDKAKNRRVDVTLLPAASPPSRNNP